MIRGGFGKPRRPAAPALLLKPRSRAIAATFKAGFSRHMTANYFRVSLWTVDQSLRKWLRLS